MRRSLAAIALFLVAACGEQDPKSPQFMDRKPCSVRGWVLDVKGAQRAATMEQEVARRTELFAATSIWIEDTQYASGGIAENGAFIILDVPPGKAVIGYQAPGADQARLPLENIPATADVFIPDVILEPGGATVLDPKKIEVRIPGDVDKPRATGQIATVAGHKVPVIEAPLDTFGNRRDYPKPPGWRPMATYK